MSSEIETSRCFALFTLLCKEAVVVLPWSFEKLVVVNRVGSVTSIEMVSVAVLRGN
jgi:hypothetical protein